MSRSLLRITVALGLVISVLSGMGVFATLSDTANGGDNSVTSGDRPSVADLRIEPGVLVAGQPATVNCDADADGILWEGNDTATPQFSVADVQPGDTLPDAYVCLKNVGAADLALTVYAMDIVNLEADSGCTGDEAASSDTDCSAGAAGELGGLLWISIDRVDCSNVDSVDFQGAQDQPLIQFPPSLSTGTGLAPDAVTCVRFSMSYPDPGEVNAQVAQSDQVTWHFSFSATAL